MVTICDNGGDNKWLFNPKALRKRTLNKFARRTRRLHKAPTKMNLPPKRMLNKFANKTNNPSNRSRKTNSSSFCLIGGPPLWRTRFLILPKRFVLYLRPNQGDD